MADRKDKKSAIGGFLFGFVYAGRGIKHLIKTERNAKIHLCVMLCTIALGITFNLSGIEWIAITICCGLVLGAEAINTAIEHLANYCTAEKNEQIRKVKDIAAGAVLICVLAAIAVGLTIFLPKVLSLI